MNEEKPSDESQPFDELLEELNQKGMLIKEFKIDGHWHYFPWGNPEKKQGAYRAIETTLGIDFQFKKWSDQSQNFRETLSYKNLSPEDLERHAKRVKEAEEAHLKRKQIVWDSVAIEAEKKWALSKESLDHPYFRKKNIQRPYGTRIDLYGTLLIPARDAALKLWGFQTIPLNGKKMNLKGGKIKGLFHLIGEVPERGPLFICEGFATAASLHECLKAPAACAFGSSSFVAAGFELRKLYPHHDFIFVGDADKVGEKYARQAAHKLRAKYIIPTFRSPHPDYTDFNDLRSLEGDGEVIRQATKYNEQKILSKQQWIEDWMETHHVRITYQRLVYIDGQISDICVLQTLLFLAAQSEDRKIPTELIVKFTENWQRDRLKEIFEATVSKLFEKPENQADAMASSSAFILALTGKLEEVDFAVLQHFIWQVKRKIKGLPVEHHLMPIITGKSGAGKSIAMKKLISPLDCLQVGSTMDTCSDERKWNLFADYPVVYMDEMANMHRTDMNALKNLITEDFLTYRSPYDRTTKTQANRATLIGTSNEDWVDIVRDPTSNRRFYALESRDQIDWETINALPYLDLWRAVDHLAECPLIAVLDQVRAIQEVNRFKSPAEEFAEEFNLEASSTRFTTNKDIAEAFQEFGSRIGAHKFSLGLGSVRKVFKSKGIVTHRKNVVRGWKCVLTGIDSFEI